MLEGEVNQGLKQIEDASGNAAAVMVPGSSVDPKALTTSMDANVGLFTKKVIGSRQEAQKEDVCYKKVSMRPWKWPELCPEGFISNGEGQCYTEGIEGRDCWNLCDKMTGACPDFCGYGKACCMKDNPNQAYECTNATGYVHIDGSPHAPHEYHQCVNLGAVLPEGEDCWAHCNGQAGPCGACGADGLCTRVGTARVGAGALLEVGDSARAADDEAGANAASTALAGRPYYGEAFRASGAGSHGTNGKYKVAGYLHGHPRYVRTDAGGWRAWYNSKKKIWILSWRFLGIHAYYYVSKEQTPTLPEKGWVPVRGQYPVPEITITRTVWEYTGTAQKPFQGGEYKCFTVETTTTTSNAPTAAPSTPSPSTWTLLEKSHSDLFPWSPWWCFWCAWGENYDEKGVVPARCPDWPEPYHKKLADGKCYDDCPENTKMFTLLEIGNIKSYGCRDMCGDPYPIDSALACGKDIGRLAVALVEAQAAITVGLTNLQELLGSSNLTATAEAIKTMAGAVVKPWCPKMTAIENSSTA